MSAEQVVPLIRKFAPSDRFETLSKVADKCAQERQRAISKQCFEEAVSSLVHGGELQLTNSGIKRVEWDAPERSLYQGLEDKLLTSQFLEKLDIEHDATVFHETASGGSQATGQFSRPDFTLATIRRFRFDPSKQLDVMTFEVKNRLGTNLLAVHEALAHSRFAHYSFVVIPKFKLLPKIAEDMRDACAEHGLGLITFSIKAVEPKVEIGDVDLELNPVRKTADPWRVERFIMARFPEEKQEALQRLANSI